MRAHAESINLEFEREISEEEALRVLGDAAGVSIIDDRSANRCRAACTYRRYTATHACSNRIWPS